MDEFTSYVREIVRVFQNCINVRYNRRLAKLPYHRQHVTLKHVVLTGMVIRMVCEQHCPNQMVYNVDSVHSFFSIFELVQH